MTITSCPMLGTPKQNAFICKLAAACGFEDLADAVNEALGNAQGTLIPEPFPSSDASRVIEWLLALAQQKGVKIWTSKRGDKAARKKAAKARTGGKSTRSIPGTDKGRTGGSTGLQSHGKALADYSSAELAGELERRGLPAELALANPDLVGGALPLLKAAARAVQTWETGGENADFIGAIVALRLAIEDTGAQVSQAEER